MALSTLRPITSARRDRWRRVACAMLVGLATGRTAIAQTPTLHVVLNEIAWMGNLTDANNEWIELHNTTGARRSTSPDGRWSRRMERRNIMLSGTIPAGGYFLLERTDDTSVPGDAPTRSTREPSGTRERS